jgi:hypothetical protein
MPIYVEPMMVTTSQELPGYRIVRGIFLFPWVPHPSRLLRRVGP